jgi:hypothetical protein
VVASVSAVVVLGAVGWWWITQRPSAVEEEATQPPVVGADRAGGSVTSPGSLAELSTRGDTGEGLPVAAGEPAEQAIQDEHSAAPADEISFSDTTTTLPMQEDTATATRRTPAPAPRSGVLVVSITGGWASIYVDDQLRREGRTHRDTLTAGEHSLRLERPGYVTVDTTVTVEPGETLTVNLPMRRAGG